MPMALTFLGLQVLIQEVEWREVASTMTSTHKFALYVQQF